MCRAPVVLFIQHWLEDVPFLCNDGFKVILRVLDAILMLKLRYINCNKIGNRVGGLLAKMEENQ